MKILSVFLILLLFLFAGAQEEPAHLSVYSVPSNVQIRLDSVIIGSTPLENLKLGPGPHRLEALSPFSGIWNMTNLMQTFTLYSNQDTTIHVRFQKEVSINSIPYNARLILKNRMLGRTPLTIPFDENQGKTFRLEKPGYRSQEFRLQKQQPYLFELEPLDLNITKEEDTSFGYALFHTRLKSKFIFLTSTVVTHWLAFYLKNVADDNYSKYRQTTNPKLIDQYWNNTKKYDRLSDISLGVSYAFLSGLIYTVLWR